MDIVDIGEGSLEVQNFLDSEWSKYNGENDYEFKVTRKCLVAKEKDKIIGVAKIKILGGTGLLSELIVSKDQRNNGVGSKLIAAFEKICKKMDCHKLYLETSEKHKEAMKFYKKQGYTIEAELKNFKFNSIWYIFIKEI